MAHRASPNTFLWLIILLHVTQKVPRKTGEEIELCYYVLFTYKPLTCWLKHVYIRVWCMCFQHFHWERMIFWCSGISFRGFHCDFKTFVISVRHCSWQKLYNAFAFLYSLLISCHKSVWQDSVFAFHFLLCSILFHPLKKRMVYLETESWNQIQILKRPS